MAFNRLTVFAKRFTFRSKYVTDIKATKTPKRRTTKP